jgi:hypothetical protein
VSENLGLELLNPAAENVLQRRRLAGGEVDALDPGGYGSCPSHAA